ncbi:MAG: response regulator transcription factor [Planctomycetota bacterium]|jgi:DNA-binding CsgD family transcriptional regulator
MPTIDEIARGRSLPGILILNQKHEAVYLSSEAFKLLNSINNTQDSPEKAPPVIPDEICRLCSSVNYNITPKEAENSCYAGGIFRGGKQYLIRTVPLFRAVREKNSGQPDIMVVIERFSIGRHLDTTRLARKFDLTEREAQVAGEIVKGSTNSEIAKSLCISEHTVKDHIKGIMDKMGVHNRTSIFCKVFE